MKLIPVVTEKAFSGAEKSVYIFKVPADAAKPEIAKAVAAAWKVTVEDVRTLRNPGKVRTRGRHQGFRPGFKKAVVRLKQGDKIEELVG